MRARLRDLQGYAIAAEDALRRVPGRHLQREAGVKRDAEVDRPACSIDKYPHANHVSSTGTDSVDDITDAAAGGEHIVDDQRAVTGADLEAALELAPCPVVPPLGDDAGKAKVAGCLVAEDDATGCRPDDHGGARIAKVVGDAPAKLTCQVGPLEDAKLLDVGVGMAPAGELEMAAEQGAPLGEEVGCAGIHGRSVPKRDRPGQRQGAVTSRWSVRRGDPFGARPKSLSGQ